MDPADYYNNSQEQGRVAQLLSLVPPPPASVLDIGARTGYISRRLAHAGYTVTALDLERPQLADAHITCIAGDLTALSLPDNSFDVVLCAEVLEHIPPLLLQKACSELLRVSKRHVVVGVPFRQDLRLWQTTCQHCGGTNPPWAHVNSFDTPRLQQLFRAAAAEQVAYVGRAEADTNAVSAWLMSLAGNPYGTYIQDEACLHCQQQLGQPGAPNLKQRALVKAALACRRAGNTFRQPHANWVHMLFSKSSGPHTFTSEPKRT